VLGSIRFPIMIAASIAVLFAVIWFVTRLKSPAPPLSSILIVSVIISAGGMIFAKFGAGWGLPWAIYYSVPALLTIFLPPIIFRLSIMQSIIYVALAFFSAPAIHYAFLMLLGWNEYMPFLRELNL